MRSDFLRVVIVGLLFTVPGAQRMAVAETREPTIDDRFLDTNVRPAKAEVPQLNAPQRQLPPPANLPAPMAQSKVTQPAVPQRPLAQSVVPQPPIAQTRIGSTNPAVAYLGVTFADDEIAPIVQSVAAGSPAHQAGLQPNDVIEKLQGRNIRTNQQLIDIVTKMRPGEVLDIEFTRRMMLRTQAPLATAPTMIPHSVGYPPQTPASAMAAPEDPAETSRARQNPNPASTQRRDDNQNNSQSDENRGLLGRGLRIR